jgi:hypothetical protein
MSVLRFHDRKGKMDIQVKNFRGVGETRNKRLLANFDVNLGEIEIRNWKILRYAEDSDYLSVAFPQVKFSDAGYPKYKSLISLPRTLKMEIQKIAIGEYKHWLKEGERDLLKFKQGD